MQIKIESGEHLGLIGSTGSGKTYFFKHHLFPKLYRVLVVDTEEMQFNEVELARAPGEKVSKKIGKTTKGFRWRWVPDITDPVESMEELSRGLLRWGHDMVVYIDELTDFSDAHSIQPYLKSLFRKGRKRRISLYWATQRPAGVNKWAFDNSVHKIYFYVDPHDRIYLDRMYRGIGDEISKIKWKSYEYIYVTPSGETKRGEKI